LENYYGSYYRLKEIESRTIKQVHDRSEHFDMKTAIRIQIAVVLPCVFLSALLHAQADEKLITSFETEAELKAWSGGEVARSNATRESKSYHVAAGTTAAFITSEDWTQWRNVEVDVLNPGETIELWIRFTDSSGETIWSFEHYVSSGKTAQRIRVDGLRNGFSYGGRIDTARITKIEFVVKERWKRDPAQAGIYLKGIMQRPVPVIGGSHVTDVGASWKLPPIALVTHRKNPERQRLEYLNEHIQKADNGMRAGKKEEARKLLQQILDRYSDAQEIQERIHSL
jgi:hypothetical protein